MAEYLITNDLLLPALQPVFDQFRDAGGDPAVLVPVFGVDPAYLAAGARRDDRQVRVDRGLLLRRAGPGRPHDRRAACGVPREP